MERGRVGRVVHLLLPAQCAARRIHLVPQLGLDYDSATVDGQTASTQAQASWIGDGWTLGGGSTFIEQSFIPCDDTRRAARRRTSTQDECYNGPVLTLSQDGTSIPLVCPVPFSYTTTSTCQAADDTGQVITHHVGSGNGSAERSSPTTGRSPTGTAPPTPSASTTCPAGPAGTRRPDSVDSVPVFSAHSGDPCYSSSGFASSACTMAYRWNLDYVTDLHGNAMAYYYDQATNAYAENGNTSSATSYIRDSHLDHIDYGFTDGNAYSGHAPDEVVFTTGDRCFASSCDPDQLQRRELAGRALQPGLLRRGWRPARRPGPRSGPRSGWPQSPPSSGTGPRTRRWTRGRWPSTSRR